MVALPREVWAPAELFESAENGDPTFGLIGDAAHGAYWLAAPATPGGAREVVLARFERSLPAELRRLVEQRSTLEVPAPDRDRFLADFLPALRRAVPVVTTDESIELPSAPVPQVTLTVGFRPEHRVRLDWSVRYHHGGEWRHFGVDDSPLGSGGLRDVAAERTLLAGLDLPYAELPQLADPDQPRRPAAHSLLGGAHAAQFVHDVLPRLIEQGVVVETDGQVLDYRPAENDPEVTVSTAATEASDWFDLHLQVRVDGELVPFEGTVRRAQSGGGGPGAGDRGLRPAGQPGPRPTARADRGSAGRLQDRDRPQSADRPLQTALSDELTQVAAVMGQADAWHGNVGEVRVDPEHLTVSGQIVGSDRKRYLVLVGARRPGGCHRAPRHLHLPGRAGLQARGRRVVHRPGPARRRRPVGASGLGGVRRPGWSESSPRCLPSRCRSVWSWRSTSAGPTGVSSRHPGRRCVRCGVAVRSVGVLGGLLV